MKYPKLAAAIDELLAREVAKNGEGILEFLVSLANVEQIYPPEPVVEKKVDIPVTKELVISHQEEVRHGD